MIQWVLPARAQYRLNRKISRRQAHEAQVCSIQYVA